MKCSIPVKCPLLIILIGSCMHTLQLFAQQSSSDLYRQASEMTDVMVQYKADRSTILRFYSTGGSDDGRTGITYNSPERRQRLLKLDGEYLDRLQKLPFEKMNVNGKADYILFKRNLDNDQYQLQEQQKSYEQVDQYLPFSDKIYTLYKPRRRGIAVNG